MAEGASVYEADIASIASIIDQIKVCVHGDVEITNGSRLVLWNLHDYPVGALELEEGQWRFTPHDERAAT